MKKTIEVLLSVVIAAAVTVFAAACGSSEEIPSAAEANPPASETASEEPAPEAGPLSSGGSTGKVFNICCWNEEFKSRVEDHYPGYETIDAVTGKIGELTVNWIITPDENGAYQTFLDETLAEQKNAAPDDRIDMFLVEADYARKYVDTEYTLPVKELGITEEELADQYKYTKDVVTDSNGVLKGVSWQGCPGVLIYNRAAAKEIFGSDDPEAVQEKVRDWDAFNATAREVKEAGYLMNASFLDSYRVFSNNVSGPWVQDGKVVVDDNIKRWMELSRDWVDAGETTTCELWDPDWSKGLYPEGKVFCYFGPAWFIDFSMKVDDEASIAHGGGWGACEGPQGYYWGGTWICGCSYSDNRETAADIMRRLTTDKEIMTQIVREDNDFVNNKPAMEAMAKDPGYKNAVLGGQNPLPMFCAGADKIDLSNISGYDQTCNEEMQIAMRNCLKGNSTLDEALERFYAGVSQRHPELSVTVNSLSDREQ